MRGRSIPNRGRRKPEEPNRTSGSALPGHRKTMESESPKRYITAYLPMPERQGHAAGDPELRIVRGHVARLAEQPSRAHRDQDAAEEIHAEITAAVAPAQRQVDRIEMKPRAGAHIGAHPAGRREVVHEVEVGIDVADPVAGPEHDAGLQMQPRSVLLEFQVSADREGAARALRIHFTHTSADSRETEGAGRRGCGVQSGQRDEECSQNRERLHRCPPWLKATDPCPHGGRSYESDEIFKARARRRGIRALMPRKSRGGRRFGGMKKCASHTPRRWGCPGRVTSGTPTGQE